MGSDGNAEFLTLTLHCNDYDSTRRFYRDVLGLDVAYEQEGHVTAMDRVCVHDLTDGLGSARELIFTVDQLEVFQKRADELGFEATLRSFSNGQSYLRLRDPEGNYIKLQTR